MGVSRARVQQRTARFLAFVRAHGISYTTLSSMKSSHQQFLLFIEGTQEIALVLLAHTSRMYLTSYEGALKTLLSAWSEQENTHLILDIASADLEQLEVLRDTLPHRPPHCHPTASLWAEGIQAASIQLSSADSPLVDLAQRLGYTVFITNSKEPPFHPHYCILNAQASSLLAEGDSLVSVLAELLVQQAEVSLSHPRPHS